MELKTFIHYNIRKRMKTFMIFRYLMYLVYLVSITDSYNLPFNNNILLPRRDIMGSIIFANNNLNLLTNMKEGVQKKNTNIKKLDHYAHWSIHGIVPPPIEKTITYSELVDSINNNTVQYIEIAIQHDCIVATTINNHRWSCLVKDKDIPLLIEVTKHSNGDQGVIIVPTDPRKANLRKVAQVFFYTYILRFITLDVPYNYRLIRQANSMNMSFREKMYYLSNKTTNVNMTELFNNTLIK